MYKISHELKFRNTFHKNHKPIILTVTSQETHLNCDSLWNTGAASVPPFAMTQTTKQHLHVQKDPQSLKQSSTSKSSVLIKSW